jgi:hypothetical protein
VRGALDASTTNVPTPDPSTRPDDPVREALGIKTYATYVKGTRSVSVDRNESLTVTPHRNAGAREGFLPIEDERISLERDADEAKLADAVRRGLDRAE